MSCHCCCVFVIVCVCVVCFLKHLFVADCSYAVCVLDFSDLEETLVVLPFSYMYVIPLLGLLDTWLKVRERERDKQTDIQRSRQTGGKTEREIERKSSVLLFEILGSFVCGQHGWEVELSCRCLLFLLRYVFRCKSRQAHHHY